MPVLINAEIALQRAEQNRLRKKQEAFDKMMGYFIEAINLAVDEGESWAQVHVPGFTRADLVGVFATLDTQGYSVFANGPEKWLVKFKKVEAIPLAETPPTAVLEDTTEDDLYDHAEEEYSFSHDDDDDIPF